jgi:signal transduction histidine kinase
MPLRVARHNLVQIIQDTCERFSPVLGERRFDFDYNANVVAVDCDAEVIGRVVENLVNNAIKYTRPDGQIEISLLADDLQVAISVSDDGVGIPPDQRERIFEKFGQIDGGGKHRHSSGIGLTFCRLAIEGHGGTIHVSEPELGGSTFVFNLPLAKESPSVLQSADFVQ